MRWFSHDGRVRHLQRSGAIYECGCSDIPAGDCDCDGSTSLRRRLRWRTQRQPLTSAGLWTGNGIPAGDCDCDGNQEDALGVCGGDCTADADADGICDDVDDCVGSSDACGICNGPGAIYECGCEDIPKGDCDCDGNQLDAWAFVAVTATSPMPTATACVTTRKWRVVPTMRHAPRRCSH